MAKQKAKGLTGDFLKPVTGEAEANSETKPQIAMTLKLPHETYVRLKELAAKRQTKGQTIMLEAVTEYLDRIR